MHIIEKEMRDDNKTVNEILDEFIKVSNIGADAIKVLISRSPNKEATVFLINELLELHGKKVIREHRVANLNYKLQDNIIISIKKDDEAKRRSIGLKKAHAKRKSAKKAADKEAKKASK